MIAFTLNGQPFQTADDDPDLLLIDVLRSHAKLTGTKQVCGAGVCGACTVIVEGKTVASCLMPASAVAGCSVFSVEGLAGDDLHPVQKAFIAHDAMQCGFCTPGFVVEALAFYENWREARAGQTPGREEIAAALSGHLCRCGAYGNIYEAVAAACAGEFEGPSAAGPRQEAADKVTGRAKYTVDIAHDGQLEGVILRSAHAHAKLTALDLEPALRVPGVKAAIPMLAVGRTVRFFGQEIAAVAAVDLASAKRGLAAIKASYEPRPAVIGLDAARRPGAADVYPGWRKPVANSGEGPIFPTPWKHNVRGPSGAFSLNGGKAKKLIAEARTRRDPLLVAGTFRTEAQSHTAFEPHAATAQWSGDSLTVHLSTQAVAHMAKAIAKRFGVKEGKVRVIAEHVGGGFGAKLSVTGETVAAVELARAAGAPVRVAFDRHEEMSVTGYRPGAELQVALLCGTEGEPSGDVGEGLCRCGRRGELGDRRFRAHDVRRARQGARRLRRGEPSASRRSVSRTGRPAAQLRAGAGGGRGRRKTARRPHRIAPALGRQSGAPAALWLDDEASGLARPRGHGGAQRTLPARRGDRRRQLALLVATGRRGRAGGARRQARRQHVGAGHGHRHPQRPGARGRRGVRAGAGGNRRRHRRFHPPAGADFGGSRTTASLVPAVMAAADALKAALRERMHGRIGDNAPWREIIAASDDIALRATRPPDAASTVHRGLSPLQEGGFIGKTFDWVLRRFMHLNTGQGSSGAVYAAEVEVDTLLGHCRVTRYAAGLAVGRVQHPVLARNQVAGSIVQGIGYALYENRQLDPVTGAVLTTGLEDYRIPGIADIPEIDIHFDEDGFEHVAGGSIGLGEIATLPVAASIANAVHDATGVRLREIPIRPDRLINALRRGAAA